MTRIVLYMTLVIMSSTTGLASFDDPPAKPKPAEKQTPAKSKLKTPLVEICGVAKSASNVGYGLTCQLVNPNARAVGYLGYAPDSFAPPLPKGRLISHAEYKRAGKWHPYPQGLCGTGMTFLVLKAKAKEGFSFSILDGMIPEWEAIRVGVVWSPAKPADLGDAFEHSTRTTIAWSKEMTRKDLDRMAGVE